MDALITGMAETNPLLYYAIGVVSFLLGLTLPFLTSNLIESHKRTRAAYSVFFVNAAVFLIFMFWTGAYLSRQTAFRARMVARRAFRVTVKIFFYLESIFVTMALDRLCSTSDDNLQARVLTGVSYALTVIIYGLVLFFGRKLRTGYEGNLLSFLLGGAYVFAVKFSDLTTIPYIVLSGALVVGSILIAVADCFEGDMEQSSQHTQPQSTPPTQSAGSTGSVVVNIQEDPVQPAAGDPATQTVSAGPTPTPTAARGTSEPVVHGIGQPSNIPTEMIPDHVPPPSSSGEGLAGNP